MLELLRHWLFPSACVACDAPGPALCAACAPAPSAAIRFAVDGVPAFALGPYDGALRAAVVAMKRGERDHLDTFAALLAQRAPPLLGALVPLPTTRGRVAERGFDQSAALARRLAALRGVPCEHVLVKRGRPQEGRGRRERLGASDRFHLCGAGLPAAVTLLDDVSTTGATLRDAIGLLRRAGVDVRRIVVLARTPP